MPVFLTCTVPDPSYRETKDKDYLRTKLGNAFEIDEPAVKRILEKLDQDFE